MTNDNDFKNNICIEDNINLKNIKIIDFKMWDSYIFKNGLIDTYEPKWANNINTVQYRPNSETPISNLFVGGSYSNTSTGTFSMESAAESGKIVAKSVCLADNKKEDIYLYTKKRSLITSPFHYVDYFVYNNYLIYLIILLLIFIISYKIINVK